MQLYKTRSGNILRHDGKYFLLEGDWDEVINQKKLYATLRERSLKAVAVAEKDVNIIISEELLAPIGNQELWAAGVTYLRSRNARMDESKDSGAADFYQKVYEAERPELFFKSLPHRIAGHGEKVYIRKDSSWNVPEPELTVYINAEGNIQGYTIGNDMSSRSIEGENPLYLPQAKMYERAAALGPCLYIPENFISSETNIRMFIHRQENEVFHGSILLNRMKRQLPELAGYLFREFDFPAGCYLMTGTGIVPPDDFTLEVNDRVTISIDGIGELVNVVSRKDQ